MAPVSNDACSMLSVDVLLSPSERMTSELATVEKTQKSELKNLLKFTYSESQRSCSSRPKRPDPMSKKLKEAIAQSKSDMLDKSRATQTPAIKLQQT